jgi:hypothetical protein
VTFRHTVQAVLKRGALVAAANWPVTLIQSAADGLFKLLVGIPLVGGIFLVALVVGGEPGALLTLDSRVLAATIIGSLVSHPLVLIAFLMAMAVVVVGGSLFVFLVKGGTVTTLVRGERDAGPVERPPLHWSAVSRAAKFGVEEFIESAQRLFPRFARLGFLLMAAYAASGGAYLGLIMASRGSGSTFGLTALLTASFVCWITFVNLLYLLTQIVIAADDCGVGAAIRRLVAFVRADRKMVGGVFLVILAMVVLATGASFVATASLGVITFVPFLGPFLGLAVLPLQILAWVMHEIVFQYIGLAAVGAYVKLYREFSALGGPMPEPFALGSPRPSLEG